MSAPARLEIAPRPDVANGRRTGLTVFGGGFSRLRLDASSDLVPDSRAGEWADDHAPRSLALVPYAPDEESGCEAIERRRG